MKLASACLLFFVTLQIASAEIICSVTETLAQSTPTTAKSYPTAKTQANQLNDAVLSGDYEKAADLTYPKLIELMGGRAKYIATLKRLMIETHSDDARIVSTVSADPTQIIELDSDVYAILPTTMNIKIPEGIVIGESSLIGVSNDHGKNWTFFDAGSGLSHEQLKTLLPAVGDRLKVPAFRRALLKRAQ